MAKQAARPLRAALRVRQRAPPSSGCNEDV